MSALPSMPDMAPPASTADLTGLQGKFAAARSPEAGRRAVREAAESFEAVFLSQMLAPMFEGVNDGDGLFGGGHAETVYRSMLTDEIGKSIARAGGIGLGDTIERELLALQEA